jgi:hypothetical protein
MVPPDNSDTWEFDLLDEETIKSFAKKEIIQKDTIPVETERKDRKREGKPGNSEKRNRK